MVRKLYCGSCDEEVKRNDKNVECDACKKKYHTSCSKLSDAECNVLSTKTNLKWYCQLCENDVKDILSNFEKFKKVSHEISKLKSDMDEKLKVFEDRLTKCEASNDNNDYAVTSRNNSNNVAELNRAELDLIESKKSNLIYFNIPESDSDNISDRMKHDFKLVSETYKNVKIDHTDITTLYRVGKKSERARPLVVKYKNIDRKNEILSSSSKLSVKYRTTSYEVFVSIDRTPIQREVHKKLVDELKNRKSNGESDLVIRNGKIIKKFPTGSNAVKVKWSDLFKN